MSCLFRHARESNTLAVAKSQWAPAGPHKNGPDNLCVMDIDFSDSINFRVMLAVWVLYFVLHGTFDWGVRHCYELLLSSASLVGLADSIRKKKILVCLCHVSLCCNSLENSDKDTHSMVHNKIPPGPFGLHCFLLADILQPSWPTSDSSTRLFLSRNHLILSIPFSFSKLMRTALSHLLKLNKKRRKLVSLSHTAPSNCIENVNKDQKQKGNFTGTRQW